MGKAKISIPKNGSKSRSPGRRGRSSSPGSGKRITEFRKLTPNSIEKQRNMLKRDLKRAMEDNVRLKAHNRLIKEQNDRYLEAFAVKDIQRQQQIRLNGNAQKEINFKILIFHKIKDNLLNVECRERFQEKNLKGLVKFAKKLTVELEQYKQKVVMAENIIKDLKKAGSESMGSLIDMMKNFKTKEENSRDEIQKLNQLTTIKDDEIVNLDVELQSLNDFLNSVRHQQLSKIQLYKEQIEDNKKVIRRQDKLIVDLQQRNEMSQNAVAITQEQVDKKVDQKDQMQVRMKELTDQRNYYLESVDNMRYKTSAFKQHLDATGNRNFNLQAIPNIDGFSRKEEKSTSPPKRGMRKNAGDAQSRSNYDGKSVRSSPSKF